MIEWNQGQLHEHRGFAAFIDTKRFPAINNRVLFPKTVCARNLIISQNYSHKWRSARVSVDGYGNENNRLVVTVEQIAAPQGELPTFTSPPVTRSA